MDESWPTNGIPSSFYSRHKAAVERQLDQLAADQPGLRIVRLRPGLIFQRSAATEIRRLFAGPLLPGALLHSRLAPVSPAVPGLRFQAVHSDDVADAYRRAVLSDVSGPFNVAADPVIGAQELAQLLDARPGAGPGRRAAQAAAVTFALRLQPAEPGWVDMALGVPLMSTERVRSRVGLVGATLLAAGDRRAGRGDARGRRGPHPAAGPRHQRTGSHP